MGNGCPGVEGPGPYIDVSNNVVRELPADPSRRDRGDAIVFDPVHQATWNAHLHISITPRFTRVCENQQYPMKKAALRTAQAHVANICCLKARLGHQ